MWGNKKNQKRPCALKARNFKYNCFRREQINFKCPHEMKKKKKMRKELKSFTQVYDI